MTSIINNENATVSQLLAPEGIGIHNNSSPSLTPYLGSLAVDPVSTSSLYFGNGSTWLNAAAGNGISQTTIFSTSVTLTASGQPSLTGSLYCISMTIQGTTTFMVRLSIDATIAVTSGAVVWASGSVVPMFYSPAFTQYFANSVYGATSLGTFVTFYITSSGALNIQYASTTSSQNVTFAEMIGEWI